MPTFMYCFHLMVAAMVLYILNTGLEARKMTSASPPSTSREEMLPTAAPRSRTQCRQYREKI